MNIVTGYTGAAHITSAQDRAGNQGAIGVGSYILNVGNKLEPVIQSATEVRIKDGAICHQGCIGVIAEGSYDAVTIDNGSQGMKRTDLIVCRYTKDAGTNVESLTLVCIKGTPDASTPVAPSYNEGNIQDGDSPVDMPLFHVNINGVSISSVTQVASNVRTQAEMDAVIGNTNMGTQATTITGAINEVKNQFTITRLDKSVTVAAGAGPYVTFTAPFKIYGVVGVSTANISLLPYAWYNLDDYSVALHIRNIGNEDITVTASVFVLHTNN